MTADELDAAIALYASQPETPDQTEDDTQTTQEADAPEQDDDDQPEPETDDDDDDDSEEEAKPSGKRHKQFRVRPGSDEDAEVLKLTRNGNLTIREALDVLEKRKGKNTPEGAEETTEPPEQTAQDTVAGIQAKIKERTAAKAKAWADYEHDQAEAIEAELAGLMLQLVDARVAEKENGTKAQTAHEAAKAEALSLYPDANTPGTPIGDALIELVKAAQADGNPILKNPKWPVMLAERAAKLVGAGKQPGQRQEQKAPIRPRPATPGQGAATPLPAYTGKPIADMTEEDIMAAAARLPQ